MAGDCKKDSEGDHYWQRIGIWKTFIVSQCQQCKKCKKEKVVWIKDKK